MITKELKNKINNIQDTLADLKEVVYYLIDNGELAKDSLIGEELLKISQDIQLKEGGVKMEFDICVWNSTDTNVTNMETGEYKNFTHECEALAWIKSQDNNAKINYITYN